MIRIIIDAMGGDKAPYEIVKGCVKALEEKDDFTIKLVGKEEVIKDILKGFSYNEKRIQIVNANQIIGYDDMPTKAIKSKKESSMVKGFYMLKEGEGEAFISAGNTGALLAGSLLIIGRIENIIRPAIAAFIPAWKKNVLLVDAGLNSSCRPESYSQFAVFGKEYYRKLKGIENPTIGLLNIGSEDSKGTKELKEAFRLLKKQKINFIGNIEGNDISEGKIDIVLCDGFTGNIILKYLEGTGTFFFNSIKEMMTGVKGKISGMFLKNKLYKFKKSIDPDVQAGAPILGINKLVLKSHGSSNSISIKNVVLKAVLLSEKKVVMGLKQIFEV